MAENVGGIYYDVTLETGQMIRDTRTADAQLGKLEASVHEVARAVQTHTAQIRQQSDAQRGATQARQAAIKAAREQAAAEKAAGDAAAKAARDRANVGRQIAPQVTDIVTGLSSGQSPFTVLIQQGGQLKDVLGGVGPALRGVGSYVLGLITPLTALAAAAAAVVAGFVLGRKESDEIRGALILTGNQTGVTAGQVNALAKDLGDLSNVTRGQAADALIAFVQAGVRGEGMLRKLAEAAIRLEQAGGPAVAETAKAFADLQKNPLQGALKLNEGTNFLTASIYKQIVALQEQGKTTEAARVAQTAYADAVLGRAASITENLGLVQRAWKGVAGFAKAAWDAMLNVGREESPDEKLETLRKSIANVQRQLETGTLANGVALPPGQEERLKALLANLQKQLATYEKTQVAAAGVVDTQAKQKQQVEALAEFDRTGEKFLDKKVRMEREIAQARELGKRAGLTELQIQERIAAIRKSYAEKREAFDNAGYLAGLEVKAAEGLAKVDAEERAALQRNKALLDEGRINRETAARAATLIEENAARERTDIYEKENVAAIEAARRRYDAEEELRRKKAEAGRFISGLAGRTSPSQRVIEEERAQLEQLEAIRNQGLISEQLYQDGRIAIAQIAAEKREAIRRREQEQEQAILTSTVSMAAQTAGDLYQVLEQAGQERTALGKAMFLASKGLAVAEIILSTNVAAARALEYGGPAGPALAAAIEAIGYAKAGIVAGLAIGQLAGGRRYGGPVSSGSLYRINEAGAPEMFTASNGAQYMLPTASGNVTPANQVGGGAGWTINVNNAPPGTSVAVDESARIIDIAVGRAVAKVDGSIINRQGSTWAALQTTNVQGRL